MVIFTETMANFMRDMARECAGSSIETEVSENSIVFRFNCGNHAGCARRSASSRKIPSGPKPGRKSKTYSYGGRNLSVKDWAREYGVSCHAMYQRLSKTGIPETSARKSRHDKPRRLKAAASGN